MSAKFDMLVKGLTESFRNPKKETSPYDTVATVVRIDGDTAYVHIAGGVAETPASKTVNCKEGDIVQVRISGGRAFIVGNATAPPTDDTTAVKASGTATKFITDLVNGIFVHKENDDENGVRITDVIDIIRKKKSVAQYGEESRIGEESGSHLLFDSESANVKKGKTLLSKFFGEGLIIYSQYGEVAKIVKTPAGDVKIAIPNVYISNADAALLGYSGLELNYFGDDVAGKQYASSVNTNGVYKTNYAFDGIYTNNSNEPIGTVKDAGTDSTPQVPTSTWTDGGFPITISPGTWLITFGGAFESNSNGMRYIVLNTSNSNSSVSATRQDIRIPPANGGQTSIQSTRIVAVDQDTDLYLHVYQNSGSALMFYPLIKAVKLV